MNVYNWLGRARYSTELGNLQLEVSCWFAGKYYYTSVLVGDAPQGIGPYWEKALEILGNEIAVAKAKQERNRRQNLRRKERDDIMRACGLVKVRGSLGGTYWE